MQHGSEDVAIREVAEVHDVRALIQLVLDEISEIWIILIFDLGTNLFEMLINFLRGIYVPDPKVLIEIKTQNLLIHILVIPIDAQNLRVLLVDIHKNDQLDAHWLVTIHQPCVPESYREVVARRQKQIIGLVQHPLLIFQLGNTLEMPMHLSNFKLFFILINWHINKVNNAKIASKGHLVTCFFAHNI